MAPAKGLTFAGAKSDVEKLKARNIDLAALLPPLDDPTATATTQDPLQQSYNFVRAARDALAVAKSGQVDNAGARVESVRDKLEETIADLQSKV